MIADLRLLLVRHGQAEANRPWVFLGKTDSPLSVEGEAQAAALSERLADEAIDAVYTSPLKRAQQTAVALARPHRLTPVVDERLIEQSYGVWEGMTLDEVSARYPAEVEAWQTDAERCWPCGGETLGEVAARARNLADHIRQVHQGKNVLVVAHGSLLNVLLCTLLQTALSWLWAYRLEMGTVSEVVVYGERTTLVRLNQD